MVMGHRRPRKQPWLAVADGAGRAYRRDGSARKPGYDGDGVTAGYETRREENLSDWFFFALLVVWLSVAVAVLHHDRWGAGRILTMPIRRHVPALSGPLACRMTQLGVLCAVALVFPQAELVYFVVSAALYIDDWLTGGDKPKRREKHTARNRVKWLWLPQPNPKVAA
jgi:hypothetical protein